MTEKFGYAGKILKVDLSGGRLEELPSSDYADRFLGGRGIAAKLYWDEVSPEVNAVDSENRLIFVNGPLAGFPGLAGSRWQICGKSPATSPQTFSYASLGGSWGAWLKFAGFDAVVIQGKSEKPVYLFLHDNLAEIRDASFLWGKSTVETRETLKQALGKDTRVAAIGPAGENLATMAIVFADDDASGSSGFGAVMGAKKLKAIAVAGSRKVTAANPEKLQELRKYILDLTRDPVDMYACGYRGPLASDPKLKKTACYGCIRGCIRAIYHADNGKKGKFMCRALNLYPGHAKKYYGEWGDYPFLASRVCDEYGLDVVAMTELILWLRRCHREGLLTDENTEIPLSKLGSMEFIETLARKISWREGFGDILAQGIFPAAESLGARARELIGDGVHKSGQSYDYGPRQYIVSGLLYATEPRAPWALLHEITKPLHYWLDWQSKLEGAYVSTEVLRAVSRRFFGSEAAMELTTHEGKALAAKKIQDREYAKECLTLCDFSWPIMLVTHSADHVGDPSLESKVLSAVTGREMDEEELYQLGERVFNLQRAILVREGHNGREADSLPEFDYTTPVKFSIANPESLVPGKDGEVVSRKGAVVDKDQFERIKDEYYQLRGWDVTTGFQTRAKLRELGLEDIARGLESKGLVA